MWDKAGGGSGAPKKMSSDIVYVLTIIGDGWVSRVMMSLTKLVYKLGSYNT